MKRKIMFRALHGNRWIFGDLFHQGQDSQAYIRGSMMEQPNTICVPVDEKTIGQFSGLDDDAGCPIYEGDIVKLSFEDSKYPPYICRFSQEDAAFGLYRSDDTSRWAYLKAYDWSEFTTKVIGNIHQNPELVEEYLKKPLEWFLS